MDVINAPAGPGFFASRPSAASGVLAYLIAASCMSGCSRRSPLDSCSWTPRGGSGSGPLARRGTATRVMADCTSRLVKVPRSRHLVETELVALDVLHHQARLVAAIGRQ